MKKNKKICVLLSAMALTCTISLAGCGDNSVNFYIGTSQSCSENTLLSTDKATEYNQTKIKIKDNQLLFTKNTEKNYDSLYLTFDGNNIESIDFTSENAKMLNTNITGHSYYIDSFCLYKTFTDEELKNDFADCMRDDTVDYITYDEDKILKMLWDNGHFDEIKNVYFGGENSDKVFLPSSNKNKTYNISGILASANFGFNEQNKITAVEESTANYMGVEKKISEPFIQWNLNTPLYNDEASQNTNNVFNKDDIVLQEDTVNIKYTKESNEKNSVKWIYEMLYNDALHNNKTSGCVANDTIDVTVNYGFGNTQKHKIECSLFADGIIQFELK